MEFKKQAYPFTTECISGYFKKLDLKDKDILTVGSSLDQAFNAILLGAKDITVYDLNSDIKEYYKIKKKLILTAERNNLYEEILKINNLSFTNNDIFPKKDTMMMNLYLQSDENYEILRNKLKNCNISFINGNIFEMKQNLNNKTYDRIILSNILQYLSFFYNGDNLKEFINNQFNEWISCLNKDGIIQLLYLYSYDKSNIEQNAKNIIKYLCLKGLELEEFPGIITDYNDAIVTYTKRR